IAQRVDESGGRTKPLRPLSAVEILSDRVRTAAPHESRRRTRFGTVFRFSGIAATHPVHPASRRSAQRGAVTLSARRREQGKWASSFCIFHFPFLNFQFRASHQPAGLRRAKE